MKQFFLTILIITSPALAAADENQVYGGLKVGMMFGTDGIDSGSVNGLKVGYNFTSRYAGELEYSTGSLDFGKDFFNAEGQPTGSIFSGVDVDTTALYGIYRSGGNLFFMAKLGISNVRVSPCEACRRHQYSGEDHTGAAFGIGLGYKRDRWSLEGEITRVADNLDLLGLDLSYHF